MDLVYLDSDILGDSYDAKLCRKRFIRYAQDHPPVLIAVARVGEAEREVWNSLKQACSFVRYFLDDHHPCEQLDGLTVELQLALHRARYVKRSGVFLLSSHEDVLRSSFRLCLYSNSQRNS